MTEFSAINCPICNGENHEKISQKFPIYECQDCTHKFAKADFSNLAAIYDDDYGGFVQDDYFQQVVKNELENNIGDKLANKARILDVGCGNGSFLLEAQKKGYQVMGIDVSPSAEEFCAQIGIKAVTGDFLTMDFEDKFDMITFWDVVEHLPNPKKFIARSYDLIRPGGWILIKVPTITRKTAKVIDMIPRFEPIFVKIPYHIQYFTRNSMTQMLTDEGFGDLVWMHDIRMRQNRKMDSLKNIVRNILKKGVKSYTGEGNLYLMAQKPVK